MLKKLKTFAKGLISLALLLECQAKDSKDVAKQKVELADKSAFYLGVGYQLSAINTSYSTKSITDSYYMVGNGFGVVLGGKFLTQRKNLEHVGLRYGIFYDQTFSSYHSYISTYGMELSGLWDFTNTPKHFFGLEVGIGIAGASYLPGNALHGIIAKNLGQQNSLFQLLVNVGARFGLGHNEIALGLKFPTIANTKNQTINGLSATTLWHRLPVMYINYIYNF
ncbi:outer membrane protein [Helicobacter cetorum]|uniref:outer membrane protein n=1 Tax=Helicobacter cetorum TaxID=138563 RepID=UPI000CF0CFE0|nr:outer membrane protein [Helicobacter cetorum]